MNYCVQYSRVKESRGALAEELVVKMHTQYWISDSRNKEANDDDYLKETALGASSDIICCNCVEKDHKKNCLKLKNQSGNNQNNDKGNKKKKFKDNCNHCGKPGHKESNYWEKHFEKKQAKYQKNNTSSVNMHILFLNNKGLEIRDTE